VGTAEGANVVSRWLVTGAAGMLGRDLMALLDQSGTTATGLTRQDLDVTDAAMVRTAINRLQPDIVVNCAAWTAVDLAESHEDEALAVNGHGAANLAAACASVGARMVQLSTDYVFDGTARQPYAESDAVAPASAYGRTKLAGEQTVLEQLPDTGYVVRTAWLYGAHGGNFVRTMIRLERRQEEVAVVDDQRGQPTSTAAVANQIVSLMSSGAPAGIYHATCSGETTWFGLAREVFSLLGADPLRVTATTTSMMQRPAPRPAYSVLGHDGWARAGLAPLDDWRTVLREAFPAVVEAADCDVADAAH
jgi:dTDP-4-dehydrorhamnose reductase